MMLWNYLKLCSKFSFQPAFQGLDFLSLLAGLVVSAWYWWKNEALPDATLGLIAVIILAVITALIVLRFVSAPYFLWRKGQAELSALKVHRPDFVERAMLRLEFHGDVQIPTAVDRENIYSWFALYGESRQIIANDANGNKIAGAEIPSSWIVSVVFERPVNFHQVATSFSTAALRVCEVKQANDRAVLIYLEGPVPQGNLEIRTRA
ncbi:MAG: hypothetical protein RLN89_08530 [Parvibaculum sp.]